MAGLLSFLNPFAPRKREENNTLLTQIRSNGVQQPRQFSTSNTQNVGGGTQNAFQSQANAEAQRQAEEQRRKQEELRRQQMEKARQEQQQRQQQEQARRRQELQARQERQNNLLSSAGLGNNLANASNFRQKLEQDRQAQQQRQTLLQQLQQQKQTQSQNQNQNTGWQKYYKEEFDKANNATADSMKSRDAGEFFQRLGNAAGFRLGQMFDNGSTDRAAERNARNRYANELMQRAYDEDGNVRDQAAKAEVDQVLKENTEALNQLHEQELAKSRMMGANYDSDYKDNRFQATANLIRNMDVSNALFGTQNRNDKGTADDARRFLANLLPGMATAPIQGGTNLSEAVSGQGLDQETGKQKELTGLERMGRGVSGGIDMAGVFFGGSGDLLKSAGQALLGKGGTQLAKGMTTSGVKNLMKSMIEEGTEEGVQQAFEFFGNGGKLVTDDGEFDGESFKQMLGDTAQATALGAIGGGLFHAGSRAIDTARSGVDNIRNRIQFQQVLNDTLGDLSNTSTNVNENVAERTERMPESSTEPTQTPVGPVQTNQDGSMVKLDANGTPTRLTDAELTRVAMSGATNQNMRTNPVRGLNPFGDSRNSLSTSNEDVETLARRAEQGDTEAQQRLAELIGQEQSQNEDWRGQSVNEIVDDGGVQQITDPEEIARQKAIQEMRGTEMDVAGQDQRTDGQSSLLDQVPDQQKEAAKAIEGKSFEELTPAEQQTWLDIHDNQVMSERQMAEALREKGINPEGMSRLDMLRAMSQEYSGNTPTVTPADEIGNNPEILPSGQAMAESRTPVQGISQSGAAEPVMSVNNLTTGAGEGTVDAEQSVVDRAALDYTPGIKKVTNAFDTSSNQKVIASRNGLDFALGDFGNESLNRRANKVNHGLNENDIFSIISTSDKQSNSGNSSFRKGNVAWFGDLPDGSRGTVITRRNRFGQEEVIEAYKNNPGYEDKLIDEFGTPVQSRTGGFSLEGQSGVSAPRGQNVTPPTESNISQNSENVNGRRSSFAQNTSQNQNFSDETRRALKDDPLTYKPATNEERMARANEILSTKSINEVDAYLRDNFFNVKENARTDEDVVLAGELAKKLDAEGQYERSTEIINKLSEMGTKHGQFIQALSLMMNRSPEGIANMAQNAIRKGGGEMTGEIRKSIVEKTEQIGRLRGEKANLIEENRVISDQIMNGEGDLTALRRRQTEIAQEFRRSRDNEARQFSELSELVSKNSPDKRSIFGSIYRAGLLSGPRTHTGNLLSNAFQNFLNARAHNMAAGMDWMWSNITGNERQIVRSDGGRWKGLKEGMKASGEVMKSGNNLWEGMDILNSGSDSWGQGGEMEFKNKIANAMVAKPTNFIFRAMSAGDLPFRYMAFENAIRTEARRQGINEGYRGQALKDYVNSRVAAPDPELQAYGMSKGNESVYDEDTMLSNMMSRVDRLIEGTDNKIARNSYRTAKTLLAPFIKVPSRVLSTAIDYSPMGVVKSIVRKVGSKNYSTGQFETDLAKSGIGTVGLVGLGYALSAAGMLTGGYPDDNNERNRWKAEGIEPNSIKIGDKYVSLNYFGPASMLMAMGSGVQQRQANGEDGFAIAGGVLKDTLNSFLEQSYVQGLNNALNAVTDSQRYGESYINSFARGLVPNILRQTATAIDPMQRQTNNIGEVIQSGIPGASQLLDAKVDTYGREIENKQTLPLGQMWDPLKISNSRESTELMDEVRRLHEVDPENKELQVTPPLEDNTLSVNGQNIKITDAQKTQLQKDAGAAAIVAMNSVMRSPEYAKLNDEQKAKALDKARSEAQSEARKRFIEINQITAENNAGTREPGGTITGDYASKAIGSAKTSGSRNKGAIEISDALDQTHKDTLNKYNSMTSDEWNEYIKGDTAEQAAAEYNLELAKYENDVASGKLSEVQKIKKQDELAKMAVSKDWSWEYREAYTLASDRTKMQTFLDTLDAETREKTVGILNGLNNAMYEAGVISKTTYNTRGRAINNLESSKSSGSGGSKKSGGSSGISSAEASALASLAKTMSSADDSVKISKNSRPQTSLKSSGSNAKYQQGGLSKYQVKMGTQVSSSKSKKG